jgi:AcrR family transcriptional regulator
MCDLHRVKLTVCAKLYIMSSDQSYGDPETRERLLRAAWDLALEQGPGLRLADVAARAGVSRQAVYLHFGDRARLLLALLAWADQEFKLGDLLARVTGARTGAEALDQMVEVHAAYSPRIDALARILEAHQYQDPAVAAALRDRLDFRRAAHRGVIARIAAEGDLANGWTVDTAADLFFAITLPTPWRELTGMSGWSATQYAERISQLLRRALIAHRETHARQASVTSP